MAGLHQRIKDDPDSSYGKGASGERITAAEESLGIPIRGSYRDFLRELGWASVGSSELYGLGDECPAYLDLVAITKSERMEMRPRLASNLLPLLNDGFGNLFCLDTSSPAHDPPIVFWDHERGEDQRPEPYASDFVTWLGEWMDDV